MPFPSFVQVAVDGAGKKILNILHSISGTDYYQQVTAIADPDTPENLAKVVDATPAAGTKGLVAYVANSITVGTPSGLTGAGPTFATVGATAAAAVAANASRKGLVLVNTSVNRISLGFGVAAVLDSGITLYPQGTYVMDAFTFSTQEIQAIASAAGSNLSIQEFA